MKLYLFIGLLFISQISAIVSIAGRNFTIVAFNPPNQDNGPIPNGRWILSPAVPNVTLSKGIVFMTVPTRGQYQQMHPFSLLVDRYQKAGAVGAICACRDDRVPYGLAYGAVGVEFKLPVGVVDLSTVMWARTLPRNQSLNIIFYEFDPNPWASVEDGVGYILISIVLGGLYGCNAIFAGYRLGMWIRAKEGIDPTLGFLCLSLEFVCNLIRILNWIFWGLHNNFRIPFIDVFLTMPWCITAITSIVITFFWLDLTSDPLYHGSFMGIMRIPALIFSILMVCGEVTTNVLRFVVPEQDFVNQIIFFYGAFVMLIVTINYVAAYRILKPFNKNVETKKKLRRIIYRIILSGLCQLLSVFFIFIFLLPQAAYTPATRTALNFCLHFFFFLQSLFLIMIFQVPKDVKGTSSSSQKDDSSMSKTKESHSTQPSQ